MEVVVEGTTSTRWIADWVSEHPAELVVVALVSCVGLALALEY